MRWFAMLFALSIVVAYLNTALMGALLLFDHLPRFVDTILLFFVGPVVLAFIVSRLSHASYEKMSAQRVTFDNSPLFIHLMVLSLLIWLIAMPADWLGITRYLSLALFRPALTTSQLPPDPQAAERAGFIAIENGTIDKGRIGRYREQRSVKSGEIRTVFFTDYYAAPATTYAGHAGIWLCDDVSYADDAPAERRAPPPFVRDNIPPRGFVITDKYRRRDCLHAVRAGNAGYSAPAPASLTLLEPSGPLQQALLTYRERTLGYLLFINLLLAALPVWWIHRRGQ